MSLINYIHNEVEDREKTYDSVFLPLNTARTAVVSDPVGIHSFFNKATRSITSALSNEIATKVAAQTYKDLVAKKISTSLNIFPIAEKYFWSFWKVGMEFGASEADKEIAKLEARPKQNTFSSSIAIAEFAKSEDEKAARAVMDLKRLVGKSKRLDEAAAILQKEATGQALTSQELKSLLSVNKEYGIPLPNNQKKLIKDVVTGKLSMQQDTLEKSLQKIKEVKGKTEVDIGAIQDKLSGATQAPSSVPVPEKKNTFVPRAPVEREKKEPRTRLAIEKRDIDQLKDTRRKQDIITAKSGALDSQIFGDAYVRNRNFAVSQKYSLEMQNAIKEATKRYIETGTIPNSEVKYLDEIRAIVSGGKVIDPSKQLKDIDKDLERLKEKAGTNLTSNEVRKTKRAILALESERSGLLNLKSMRGVDAKRALVRADKSPLIPIKETDEFSADYYIKKIEKGQEDSSLSDDDQPTLDVFYTSVLAKLRQPGRANELIDQNKRIKASIPSAIVKLKSKIKSLELNLKNLSGDELEEGQAKLAAGKGNLTRLQDILSISNDAAKASTTQLGGAAVVKDIEKIQQKEGFLTKTIDKTLGAKTNVAAIAQTEMGFAFNMGRLEQFVKKGYVYFRWVADIESLMGKNCPYCKARDYRNSDRTYHISEITQLQRQVATGKNPFMQPGQNVIPAHPKCNCYWEPVGKDDGNVPPLVAGVAGAITGDAIADGLTAKERAKAKRDTERKAALGQLANSTARWAVGMGAQTSIEAGYSAMSRYLAKYQAEEGYKEQEKDYYRQGGTKGISKILPLILAGGLGFTALYALLKKKRVSDIGGEVAEKFLRVFGAEKATVKEVVDGVVEKARNKAANIAVENLVLKPFNALELKELQKVGAVPASAKVTDYQVPIANYKVLYNLYGREIADNMAKHAEAKILESLAAKVDIKKLQALYNSKASITVENIAEKLGVPLETAREAREALLTLRGLSRKDDLIPLPELKMVNSDQTPIPTDAGMTVNKQGSADFLLPMIQEQLSERKLVVIKPFVKKPNLKASQNFIKIEQLADNTETLIPQIHNVIEQTDVTKKINAIDLNRVSIAAQQNINDVLPTVRIETLSTSFSTKASEIESRVAKIQTDYDNIANPQYETRYFEKKRKDSKGLSLNKEIDGELKSLKKELKSNLDTINQTIANLELNLDSYSADQANRARATLTQLRKTRTKMTEAEKNISPRNLPRTIKNSVVTEDQKKAIDSTNKKRDALSSKQAKVKVEVDRFYNNIRPKQERLDAIEALLEDTDVNTVITDRDSMLAAIDKLGFYLNSNTLDSLSAVASDKSINNSAYFVLRAVAKLNQNGLGDRATQVLNDMSNFKQRAKRLERELTERLNRLENSLE